MVNKTNFLKYEIDKLLGFYDLGKLLEVETFENGADNTVLLLNTTKGKFVFRLYEKRQQEHVEYELDLLNFLKGKRYPVASAIKDKNGKFFNKYNGKIYVIFEYLIGNNVQNPNTTFNLFELEAVSGIIAKLNYLTTDYYPKNFKSREGRDKISCWNAAKSAANFIDNSELRQQRLSIIKQQLETINLPEELPKSVCHADCNHGNFLLLDNKVTGVVDFDQSCNSYAIYDLASLIYWWTWAPDSSIDLQKAKKICAAYQKERNVSLMEKQHLFDCLKLVALMGVAWSIADDDFEQEISRLYDLDLIGRDGIEKLFY